MGMYDKISRRWMDSIYSFVSAIGGVGDKGSFSATYVVPAVTQVEIDAAYRSSWLARKVIDIPAQDMTREWRNWQAKDNQIEELEATEDSFKIIKKTEKALKYARLYGGGALILGVEGQGESNVPLDPLKVQKGDLKFIHVLSKNRLSGQDMDMDPGSENFGNPRMWQISGGQSGKVFEVHPSRVIRFLGNEIPDDSTQDGWGDPFWMSLRSTITDADLTAASISYLVQEAKIDVIQIPGLMDLIGTTEDENKLLRRLSLANQQKTLTNVLMLDGGPDGKSGEVFTRKEMNFGGLTDIMRLSLAMCAGAADIPATRLLGKSPDGMNASGDNDLRNYYDMLASKQKLEMWPTLFPLDQILQLNMWGKIDENIFFESAPLWQMTPVEKADISAKKAATTKIYNDLGVIPELVMAEIVKNQLIEDQVYPGIEAAYDEFGTAPDETNMFALPAPPDPLLLAGPNNPDNTVSPTDHRAHLRDAEGGTRLLDPTNTGNIRKAWKMSVSTLMKKAETRIKQLIKSNEGVGLEPTHYRDLLDMHLGGRWFQKFVVRAYRKGMDDAHTRLGSQVKFAFGESDIQSMNQAMLKTQNEFSAVIDETSRQIHEGVRQSITVDEALSRVTERMKAIGVVRGHAVAVVNTIGTHALASLNHYKAAGIKKVGADVEGIARMRDELLEFATAGDNDVCPECEDLEGQVFDIEESFGIIPVHPNCRCAWIPIRDESGRFNKRVGDASPKSLYVHRKVINSGQIIEWARTQGFTNPIPGDEMHVTICYSRTPVDWIKMGEAIGQDDKGQMVVKPGGARLVERLGPEAIVLLFNSAELSYRHMEIRRKGAAFDYDEFQPHVTITYVPMEFDPSKIEPYKGEIILGPETFEEINDDYRAALGQ